MAAGGEHHRPAGSERAPRELVRQAGLPDAGLALDHGQAAIRLGAGVGVDERGQLLGASDERQLGRRLAGLAGAASARAGRGPPRAAPGVPSFTCS